MKRTNGLMISRVPVAALIGFGLSFAASSAGAQNFEMPPTLSASELLPAELLKGPNHEIDQRVTNDGYMNHYVIRSRFGEFNAVSTPKLRKRIDEIAALAAMEKVKGTSEFGDAVVKSGKAAVDGAKQLVTNPVETVTGAVSGIGKIFGRVDENLFGAKRSDHEEGRLQSLIGYAELKREYAAEFGVDAYSHNQVLQDELDDISWTGYTGELLPSLALAAVPGGAGVAVSVSQNADMLNNVFRKMAPLDLRKMNREKLKVMGASEDVAELFIDNSVYTPREQTLLVTALEAMKGVEGRKAFVKTAILADNTDVTYFRQRQAQMYAAYHKKVSPIMSFVAIGELSAAKLASGILVFMVPLDLLAWTEQTGSFISNADAYIDQNLKPAGFQVVLAGKTTELARSKFKALGWTVTENAESQLLSNLPY
ncbi:MAG: hypothetical protein ACI96M_004153 [Candidatus Azotimanducaceae bacterium]|jgi:hypothetical protein